MWLSWLDAQRYVESGKLSRYARISLPYGLMIPGEDHTEKINVVFPGRLDGLSVLDVGCHYGLYLHEARKKGAGRVVGVERDIDRYTNARKIAAMLDDGVEVLRGDALTLDLDEKFDLVLFMSVLHHVNDPLTVMRRLAGLCRGTVIVEFPLHTHQLRPQANKGGRRDYLAQRLTNFYSRMLLNLLDEKIGLIVTGDRIGNTFVYNKTAFRTVFQVQHKLFSEIKFIRGPLKRHRMFAFCKVRDNATA
jgi:2-polyprenyl-3-methyl-5-hydroxy-6-metoxy-1,4-benzoquinol methylase